MQKTFEKELPEGYKQVYYLNAKDTKVGLIMNLVAFLVLGVVMGLAAIPLIVNQVNLWAILMTGDPLLLLIMGVFFVAMIVYIILHELVHGAVYKAMTREKLSFGLSWSCAFCGVPEIYTYRKTALSSVVAPLIVFTVLLLPLTAWMYFVHPIAYLAAAFLFGMHLGGCSGDIYVAYLFLFKYKDSRVLMRDTGPEQYMFVPEKE